MGAVEVVQARQLDQSEVQVASSDEVDEGVRQLARRHLKVDLRRACHWVF